MVAIFKRNEIYNVSVQILWHSISSVHYFHILWLYVVTSLQILWLYDGFINTTVPHSFTIIRGKDTSVDTLRQYKDSRFNIPYYRATDDNVK